MLVEDGDRGKKLLEEGEDGNVGRAVFRDVGEGDLFFAAVLGVVEVDHL